MAFGTVANNRAKDAINAQATEAFAAETGVALKRQELEVMVQGRKRERRVRAAEGQKD